MTNARGFCLPAACASLLAFAGWTVGCGPPAVPAGPAPEYERPKLAPWDAAPPPDPFDIAEAQADWVDDEVPDAADAGAGDDAGPVNEHEGADAGPDQSKAPGAAEGEDGSGALNGPANAPRAADGGPGRETNEAGNSAPKQSAPPAPK